MKWVNTWRIKNKASMHKSSGVFLEFFTISSITVGDPSGTYLLSAVYFNYGKQGSCLIHPASSPISTLFVNFRLYSRNFSFFHCQPYSLNFHFTKYSSFALTLFVKVGLFFTSIFFNNILNVLKKVQLQLQTENKNLLPVLSSSSHRWFKQP